MKKKTILLYVLLFISCLAFELLFCNSLFLKGKSSYVFSFSRLFLYALLFFIANRISKKIVFNRLEYEKSKKKNFVDIFLIISFLIILVVDVFLIVKGKTNIMSQGIVVILLCYISFLYFFYSGNFKLNILLLCSICFIYSIVVTPLHAIDEPTHFVSSYNLSNFDYNWNNGYVVEAHSSKEASSK